MFFPNTEILCLRKSLWSEAGVPQKRVLGPIIYLLYTSNILELDNNRITTLFADDTAVMVVSKYYEGATIILQNSVNKINNWSEQWRNKLNETKSAHINFTNKRDHYISVVGF